MGDIWIILQNPTGLVSLALLADEDWHARDMLADEFLFKRRTDSCGGNFFKGARSPSPRGHGAEK
jgi:hypothetical protein